MVAREWLGWALQVRRFWRAWLGMGLMGGVRRVKATTSTITDHTRRTKLCKVHYAHDVLGECGVLYRTQIDHHGPLLYWL